MSVERTDIAFNAEPCPHCGKRMSTLFTIDKRDPSVTAVSPNAVVICHHCTGVSIVDAHTKLVKFTTELVREMDPRDIADIMLVVGELRHRKQMRGEEW